MALWLKRRVGRVAEEGGEGFVVLLKPFGGPQTQWAVLKELVAARHCSVPRAAAK